MKVRTERNHTLFHLCPWEGVCRNKTRLKQTVPREPDYNLVSEISNMASWVEKSTDQTYITTCYVIARGRLYSALQARGSVGAVVAVSSMWWAVDTMWYCHQQKFIVPHSINTCWWRTAQEARRFCVSQVRWCQPPVPLSSSHCGQRSSFLCSYLGCSRDMSCTVSQQIGFYFKTMLDGKRRMTTMFLLQQTSKHHCEGQ